MNESEKFLKACSTKNLKLQVVEGDIFISGDTKFAEQARRSLDNFKELKQSVTAILRERAVNGQAQALQAQGKERQAESEHDSAYVELDGRAACLAALESLTEGAKSNLNGFIAAYQRRGLILMADDKRRVYFERLDGEPINGDVSDLFTLIYGWAECMLLVYLGSKYRYFGDNLKVIAQRFNCDLFTAAYLATGMKRDLYIATCADWDFKPEHIPPELEEPIKFKPVPSDTTLRIFEVENQRGERFKFQTSCNDKYLPDALKGLRVIRELTYRPTASASSHTGDKSD